MNKSAEELKEKHNGDIDATVGPICLYCNCGSTLHHESKIYGKSYKDKNIWLCNNHPNCDAYVGVHGNGNWMNYPLGRLARKELRLLKSQAHTLLDGFWKKGYKTRSEMYTWIQKEMKLSEPEAHIGEMNEDQCRELIHKLNLYYDYLPIHK